MPLQGIDPGRHAVADMLVNLYALPRGRSPGRTGDGQVRVDRALAADARSILRFVETNSADHWPDEDADRWLGEVAASLTSHPPTCFIAVHERTLVGFACYDATAKGFFGPMAVLADHRRLGIGRELLLASLHAMREAGYGYAVIGWPARRAVAFYERTVGARLIDLAGPSVYGRLIDP